MAEKKCFKCGEIKELSCFYKHSQMADGHLNKCKECTKSDVILNRSENVEYYRDYDNRRSIRQSAEYRKYYRAKFPNKYKAHTKVHNAIRDKRLIKMPCEICQRTDHIHGHHDDYLKPLSVRWLCPIHHKEWHQKNGAGKNAA